MVREPQKPIPRASIKGVRWGTGPLRTPSRKQPTRFTNRLAPLGTPSWGPSRSTSCQRSRAPGTAPEATRANSCSSKRKRRSAIPALVPGSPGEPSPWRRPSEAARLAPSGMAFMAGFERGVGRGSFAGLAISEAPQPAAQFKRYQTTAHGETRQPQGLPGLALA